MSHLSYAPSIPIPPPTSGLPFGVGDGGGCDGALLLAVPSGGTLGAAAGSGGALGASAGGCLPANCVVLTVKRHLAPYSDAVPKWSPMPTIVMSEPPPEPPVPSIPIGPNPRTDREFRAMKWAKDALEVATGATLR